MIEEQEKPPFFKSWNSVYAILIGSLILLIITFYALTTYFS